VHELNHDQLKTMKEMLEITTWHASGKEAVRAVFVQGDGKMAPTHSRGAPPKSIGKGTKRSANGS
jgi:hypothetical protein